MFRRSARLIALTTIVLMILPLYAFATSHEASTTSTGEQTTTTESTEATDPAAPDETTDVESAEPKDKKDKPAPGTRGQEQRAASHAKVAERLKAMLATKTNRNEKATARVEAVIAKMSAEATATGEAATAAEALASIEAAVEAESTATVEQLDILAEVKIQLGKKDQAKQVLRDRLAAKANSKAAYEKLITLEAEAGEQEDLDTFVAGQKVKFDVRPAIKEGRTLMPIRALVESLGANITWNAETRTVTIQRGESTIILQIGSNVALVNGAEVLLDVAAEIEGGRTLVPARFVSEGLGLYVSWLAQHRTILVTEEPVVADTEEATPQTAPVDPANPVTTP